MKKIISLFLLLLLAVSCISCGDSDVEKDDYTSVCSQLEKTSMSGTVYSQNQTEEFENRFEKMNLAAGFKKVNHFKSQTEYAYVIEFESVFDAQAFFENVSAAGYNVKRFNYVVVYGESDSIDTLK